MEENNIIKFISSGKDSIYLYDDYKYERKKEMKFGYNINYICEINSDNDQDDRINLVICEENKIHLTKFTYTEK